MRKIDCFRIKKHCLVVTVFCGLLAMAESPVCAQSDSIPVLNTNGQVVPENIPESSGFKSALIVGAQNITPSTGAVSAQPRQLDIPHFDDLFVQNIKNPAAYINRLQLVKSPSDSAGKALPSDQVYKDTVNALAGVTSRILEAEQRRPLRYGELMAAANKIGEAEDAKAAIEENSRLQVQTIQAIHDLTKVMNGVLTSLQLQDEQYVSQISDTAKMFQ